MKIQKAASSIEFLNQSLYHNFIPTFAKIKGLFNSTNDKHQAERKIIKRHLTNHHSNLKSLRIKHEELISYLLQILGKIILRIMLRNITKLLRMNNLKQLKTKNKKIYHLKPSKPMFNYQVPIINLSDFEIDTTFLKYGYIIHLLIRTNSLNVT